MTVLFVPDYTDGNPYQSNLADELDEEVTYGNAESAFPVVGALLTEDIDVVHVHWLNSYFTAETRREAAFGLALFVLRLAAIRLAGVAVVWTVHNVWTHESAHPWLERRCKRWFVRSTCDRLVVHCEAVTDNLVAELDLDASVRDRVTVIPHGHYVDNYENDCSRATARQQLGVPDSATVFLFFGLIRRYKGVLDLVDAFEQLAAPETYLLVAGNPATETLEAELSRRTESGDRMRGVYEYVPNDDIQQYMNAADVVVLPFQKVSTSGSAILAMSFGKALVVPELGCLPAVVDEAGGVQYDPDRSDGLLRALEAAMDRDLDAMGQHNFERVQSYDWETIADRTQAVYASARETPATHARAPDADQTV